MKQLQRSARTVGRGFTLIELLVVVAIIALLAAILFPVFARARENARRASCQSNMKQIGLGIIQYSQDNDEQYPPAENYGFVSNGEYVSWKTAVYPYVKSIQIFQCPSNTTKFSSSGCGKYIAGQEAPCHYVASNYTGYTGPNDYGPLASTDGSPKFRSLSFIENPSQLIMVAEARTLNFFAWDYICTPPSCTNWDNHNFLGHLGTANFLFVDGHVKAMRPTATLNSSGTVNLWNQSNSAPTDSRAIPTLQEWEDNWK